MIIRPYLSGEEPAIWEVYFRTTHESNARDYHPELLHRWAPVDQDMGEWRQRCEEKKPLVAVVDGRVVGMAELERDGFVDYFYVSPDVQGRGIGSALLARVVREAVAMKLPRLTADVSLTAKTFFEAHGFRVMEARENVILGHAAPNFAMVRELPEES